MTKTVAPPGLAATALAKSPLLGGPLKRLAHSWLPGTAAWRHLPRRARGRPRPRAAAPSPASNAAQLTAAAIARRRARGPAARAAPAAIPAPIRGRAAIRPAARRHCPDPLREPSEILPPGRSARRRAAEPGLVSGGQVRSAELQDGHTLKTPSTAIRMAPDRRSAANSGTSDDLVNHAPRALRPNRPGITGGPIRAAASAERIVFPDGPASMRGRQHPTAGIFGGMPPATAPGQPASVRGRPGERHADSRTSDTYSARPGGQRSRHIQTALGAPTAIQKVITESDARGDHHFPLPASTRRSCWWSSGWSSC